MSIPLLLAFVALALGLTATVAIHDLIARNSQRITSILKALRAQASHKATLALAAIRGSR